MSRALRPALPYGQISFFYPSNDPLRAFIAEAFEATQITNLEAAVAQTSLREALAVFGHALARNPWQHTYGLLLREVIFARRDEDWFIADAHGEWLAVSPKFSEGWRFALV